MPHKGLKFGEALFEFSRYGICNTKNPQGFS